MVVEALTCRRFATAQLCVRGWEGWLADAARRERLEKTLIEILTPPVLAHLPQSMQLSENTNALDDWISARVAQSAVHLVSDRQTDRLLGLLILVLDRDGSELPHVHLGYLFAEAAWGHGYATELLSGLVASYAAGPSALLVGGVGTENTASARVLEKSGFVRKHDPTGADTTLFTRQVPSLPES